MREYLEKVRKPIVDRPMMNKVFDTLVSFLIGIGLGIVSKILDLIPLEVLSETFNFLDLGAFFSRMSIWLLFALIISVVSKSPIRAAVNVFVFFVGMLFSYYSYWYIVSGFFHQGVIKYWLVLALVSPILAVLCWYARGETKLSVFLTSVILAVFIILSFSFDIDYFSVRHNGMEVVNLVLACITLYRKPKQFVKALLLAILLAICIRFFYIYILMGQLSLGFMKL